MRFFHERVTKELSKIISSKNLITALPAWHIIKLVRVFSARGVASFATHDSRLRASRYTSSG